MGKIKKPLPVVNPWAKPFWEGARERKLLIQKCKDCEKFIFYPRIVCPYCFSENVEWVEASGKGTIYSYTVVVNNAPSAFIDDMPYVVAIIKLEEGVQMLSNIVGCEPSELKCDMPVEVTFEKLNDGFTLPKFKPAKE
ncbi:MAG: Zn-ribbon domain-containing OB-fold protein [Deltaproteobacteria bacterium]|nr:Zn-ribbon domain-containing OB-fold protein [Deltaproteobacteria bacterium]MBW1921408.1 Zn-ribbon domain-containing OB-fold protein [Deltaproteobacteria bacterium]MBW1934244.1 Zn-ribbon domain-containing OB-fold protein [Deltaproteobacteria bacterium]MBW1977849.1 Zn-ribbon domain-containing OB-fold protein [Deltaproteobacteria bacterium]MBW2044626.1 Zn-ribbon domain-containing OB-fold protein [Deltaproteobacteria bacterium]